MYVQPECHPPGHGESTGLQVPGPEAHDQVWMEWVGLCLCVLSNSIATHSTMKELDGTD